MDKNSFDNKPGLIINEHAGAISLINDHGKESVNISHISGASISMNPMQTAMFSPENRTDTTLNDEYKTVLGDMTEFVSKSKNVSVGGDYSLTFGEARAWLNNATQQYFDKFTEAMAPFVKGDINRPTIYPVAGLPVDEYPMERGQLVTLRLNPTLELLKNNFCESLITTVDNPIVLNDFILDFKGLLDEIKLAINLLTDGISGLIHDLIKNFRELLINNIKEIIQGFINELKQKLIDILCEFLTIPNQLIQFINTYVSGISAAVQSILSLFLKKETHSTQGNTYTTNDKSDLDGYLIQQQEVFLEIERNMGVGGNGANNVLKNKIDNIGGGSFNKNIPLSWDPQGREITVGPYIDTYMGMVPLKGGVHLPQRSVVNDACDIGNYMLNVGKKFTVNSGGGGVALNSLGPIDITTPMATIDSHIFNLESDLFSASCENIVFESKNLFTLKAPLDIVIDSNCYISNNFTTQGGAFFNGEVHVNHITAPLEMQETMEDGWTTATFQPGSLPPTGIGPPSGPGGVFALRNLTPIPVVVGGVTGSILTGQLFQFEVAAVADQIATRDLAPLRGDPITVRAHSHSFPNIPLTLTKGTPIGSTFTVPTEINPYDLDVMTAHSELRGKAQAVLNTEPALAFRIKDGNKWDESIPA
jgi:hypothetical protein